MLGEIPTRAVPRVAGLYPIRGAMGVCHLLVAGGEACLIDTGLFGENRRLCRLLRRLRLAPGAVRAILLTHGHIDHTGNLAAWKEWTGASVHAHAEEVRHVAGTHPYAGTSRWCGRLEAAGRWALRWRPSPIESFFADGDLLPLWGGLRVVHLPGHTAGHCGFYSETHDLLFSGDLFASYFFNVHLPPPILNSEPERIPASLRRVEDLKPRRIFPNHYDWPDGELHRRRFDHLLARARVQRTQLAAP